MNIDEEPKPSSRADQKVIDDIKTFGWHVVLVSEDDDTPGWAFTIGLTRTFDHPELIVFGLRQNVGHRLLNEVGGRVREGHRYQPGEKVEGLLESATCLIRPVVRKWFRWFVGYAQWYYQGRQFDLMQVVWPDHAGLFPWEPGFDQGSSQRQPLLEEEDRHLARCDALLKSMKSAGEETA